MQTRRGFFETNSSSTHSLVIIPGDIILPVLTEQELECGIITTECDEFGWEVKTFYGFRKKLKYLATYLMNTSYNNPVEKHREMLEKVLSETLGCDLVIAPNSDDYYQYGYIDHQSIEGGLNGDVFESGETLKMFLFSNTSFFMTDNDNH